MDQVVLDSLDTSLMQYELCLKESKGVMLVLCWFGVLLGDPRENSERRYGERAPVLRLDLRYWLTT